MIVTDLWTDDKSNKFVERFKTTIDFEVRKKSCMKLDDAKSVALWVGAALNGSRRTALDPLENYKTLMETGILEKN